MQKIEELKESIIERYSFPEDEDFRIQLDLLIQTVKEYYTENNDIFY